LAENKLLPEAQKQQWGQLKDRWNTQSIATFTKEIELSGARAQKAVAGVSVHDDGKVFYFEVQAEDRSVLEDALKAGLSVIGLHVGKQERVREDCVRTYLRDSDVEAPQLVRAAATAAASAIEKAGLAKDSPTQAPQGDL
jgi:hypothetical protein